MNNFFEEKCFAVLYFYRRITIDMEKMIFIRYFLIFLTLTGCFVACGRSVPQTGTSVDSIMLEQSVDREDMRFATDGILQFEPTLVELGALSLGNSRNAQVVAINRGAKPLVILDVYTSCRCTKVVWDKKPVAPGGKTTFNVHYTADEPGAFFKKIVVRHSGSQAPVTFAIQGVVIVTK